MSARIAIVSDDPGWHGKRLTEAFQNQGCTTRYVRLQDTHILIDEARADIKLPGFEQLPDGVFVRGVPGGTLEEVMHYLDILHALETLGVPVINNTRCIERSVDKAMTSFLLKHAGLPTPATWIGSDVHAAYEHLREGLGQGQEFVMKPIFGSQGKGLRHIRSVEEISGLDEYSGVFYVQEFIPLI